MRLKNKKWTIEFLEKNKKYLINDNKYNFKKLFLNDQDIELEIGCGKGNFIITKALHNKNINYLALEKERSVIGVALKKALQEFKSKEEEMNNLLFINNYFEKVFDYFPKQSISKIYLNFSDPWPKKRHAKYRITGSKYLKMYSELLKENGVIEIKTDNENLYNFTLEEIKNSNYTIIFNTNDLYNSENIEENIATEYETKFHKNGIKIKKITLILNKN